MKIRMDKKTLHEATVQEFITELKTLTENYNTVKMETEAMRQKYDTLQQENQELRENLREQKPLRVQEQLEVFPV